MEEFGFVRVGQLWVLKRNKVVDWLVRLLGIGLLVIGLGSGLLSENTGTGARVFFVVVIGGLGAYFLISPGKERQYIDPERQIFGEQSLFGRHELPFAQVKEFRPVYKTLNGVNQGIHFEAVPANQPAGQAVAVKVSPNFFDESEAVRFGEALHRLLEA